MCGGGEDDLDLTACFVRVVLLTTSAFTGVVNLDTVARVRLDPMPAAVLAVGSDTETGGMQRR